MQRNFYQTPYRREPQAEAEEQVVVPQTVPCGEARISLFGRGADCLSERIRADDLLLLAVIFLLLGDGECDFLTLAILGVLLLSGKE